jgi:hypothetical protein
VDLTDGVTVRLSSLCLDAGGRLRDYALWDAAARGALLVDLARTDRLTQEEDSVVVDSTPTGFAPADRLLGAIGVEPERSFDWWLDHGAVRMVDIAEANVASGRWSPRRRLWGRRYGDASQVTAADRALGAGPPDAEVPIDTAAVLVLARACGATGLPVPVTEAELARTGPLRWICVAVTDHLAVAHQRNALAAGSLAMGGPGF